VIAAISPRASFSVIISSVKMVLVVVMPIFSCVVIAAESARVQES
jgi:hypothetical protein